MGALTSANAPGVYMHTEKPIQPLTPNHNNFSWIFGEAPIFHVMIIFQLKVYHHFHLDGLNLQEKSELCPIFQSFRSPMVLVFPLGTSPFSKMDSMTWCAKLWTHSSPTSTKSSSTRAEVTSSGTQLRGVCKRGGGHRSLKAQDPLAQAFIFQKLLWHSQGWQMMCPGLPVLLVKRPKFHRLESSSTDRSAVKPTVFFWTFSLQRITFYIYIYFFFCRH